MYLIRTAHITYHPLLYKSLYNTTTATMAAVNVKAPQRLLHTLQNKPPSTCKAERIDFTSVSLPEYEGKFAVLIHDLLSPEECNSLLSAAETAAENKWDGAMVNVGAGRQEMMTDIRLCGRILWDTPEIVERLLERIRPHLPGEIVSLRDSAGITGAGPVKRKETWKLARLNERLRYLKYTKGMYFRRHMDGSYVTPDGSEISFLTVHIYLNGSSRSSIIPEDSGSTGATPTISSETSISGSQSQSSLSDQDLDDYEKSLKGGATRFFGYNKNHFDVNPAAGACLVFQHRALLHSGEEVEQGTKYTIRTDIMYRKAEQDDS